ncbi:ribosome-inactivating family protein [Streptomyces sp. ME18-1-4]|uniref:ribosome-inactivating family protein n=1 Tax=Streptomyces sp. ME18-1-4 TaxID=3028685 RepID=UPI0029AEDA36|nr:ribosome-inactivating family protein [Streptomyces sp. ME18-1-4]MDX3249459.1 ribosome-inactivating family protein [Streptomyces sp. ME18-1-4]
MNRLSALVLSLTVSMGLLDATSAAAVAAPHVAIASEQVHSTSRSSAAQLVNWPVINWDISSITDGGAEMEQRYYQLISQIHSHTYGGATGESSITQTTQDPRRIIQIQVNDTNNQHLVSFYMWADTLYIAGYYSPGSNEHWAFQDDRTQLLQQVTGTQFRFMPRTGSYSSLTGGNSRQDLHLGAQSIYSAMAGLHEVRSHDNVRTDRGLLMAITIFSEAARFSPILDRVRQNIREWRDDTLSLDYANMENNWGSLSTAAHAWRTGHNATVNVIGQNVNSFDAMRRVLHFVELHGSEARL